MKRPVSYTAAAVSLAFAMAHFSEASADNQPTTSIDSVHVDAIDTVTVTANPLGQANRI